MKIFNFDPKSGELISEAKADESPLEPGVFLIPAYATDTPPPAIGAHQVAVFADGAWTLKADFRGTALFSTADGAAVAASDIGQTPAMLGATEQPRPGPQYAWDGSGWAIDPALVDALFEQAKQAAFESVLAAIAQRRSAIAGTTDSNEVAGRTRKRAAADAVVAGTASEDDTLLLKQEAVIRGLGESIEDLARAIIAKAQRLDIANAIFDGTKKRASLDLLTATDAQLLAERADDLIGQIGAIE